MKTAIFLLLVVLTALRLWLAGSLEVTPLEAYYWLCAHRLDWAFFDGPGGTAVLVKIGSQFLGDGSLGLRLVFPLLALAASGGAFLLGRALFGAPAGLWAALALNVLPFFNLAAVHAGPELPALTFTLFAAWAFVRAMDRGLLWWLLGGACLSLGALFHYAAILLLPGAAAACIASARHRVEWRRPGIYAASFLALSALLPAWQWNRTHDWPALASGTFHTMLVPRWNGIAPALGSTFQLFSVFALAALLFTLGMLALHARLHARPRLALCLAAPFALLWLYDILHGGPGTTAGLLVAGLLAGAAAHVFLESRALRVTGGLALLLAALFAGLALPAKWDPWTSSSHGMAWGQIAHSLDDLLAKAQRPGREQPLLIAQDPDGTSALNYHLAHTTHPEVFLKESQDVSNQYGLWPRYDDFVEVKKAPDEFFQKEGRTDNPYKGRDALYLTEEEPGDLPQTITAAFARWEPFAVLELPGGRKMRVYLCQDYQTMPL